MKKMLIAGNWKMNTNISETAVLISEIKAGIKNNLDPNVQILVCPPFVNLLKAVEISSESRILVGAQNCSQKESGAFTGEISVSMIKALGANHIIIGHSERRQYFAETNELINEKALAIQAKDLVPIICIGETLVQRNAGETFSILSSQLDKCLNKLDFSKEIVVAYEPVWAIGTGISATTEQVVEAHNFLRSYIAEKFGSQVSNSIALLYGGSLSPANADEILAIENVNGGLIGGASLKSESFLSIINSAQKVINS